jgi:hypothetical protein
VASLYKERLLLLVLAQGGALHFTEETTGLKDVDVWASSLPDPTSHSHRGRGGQQTSALRSLGGATMI